MSVENCDKIIAQAYFETQKGDFQKAKILLQTAYEQGCDKLGSLHVGFGIVYEHNKQFAKALAAFNYAIKVEPTSHAYNNRGRMYFSLGDWRHALADYQMTIQLQPENARGHFNIAEVYLEQGKLEDALPYLQESSRLGYQPAHQLLHRVQSQTRNKTKRKQSQTRWDRSSHEQRSILSAFISLACFAYQMIGPHSLLKSQQKENLFGLSTRNVLKEEVIWNNLIEPMHEYYPQGIHEERNGATLEIRTIPSFIIRVTMPTDESYQVAIWTEYTNKNLSQTAFRKQEHHTWNIQQNDLEEKLNSLLKDEVIKVSQKRFLYSL